MKTTSKHIFHTILGYVARIVNGEFLIKQHGRVVGHFPSNEWKLISSRDCIIVERL